MFHMCRVDGIWYKKHLKTFTVTAKTKNQTNKFLNKLNKTDKYKQHYSSVDVGHGVSSQILN